MFLGNDIMAKKKSNSITIPQEIIDRKKVGFTTPLDEWFQ
jgi:hypothetical protein